LLFIGNTYYIINQPVKSGTKHFIMKNNKKAYVAFVQEARLETSFVCNQKGDALVSLEDLASRRKVNPGTYKRCMDGSLEFIQTTPRNSSNKRR
jgi:hypothetical protein